ncbi:MAG: dUTPase [Gordonia sp.]|nr:dUTPase [Gordonia sp. (in: high G+C Gram-positive bacteria)]
MATDYDAPRTAGPDADDEVSLEALTARRAETAAVDVDDTDDGDAFELPGADLSGEELTVRVVPKQSDEFTCMSCFLVHHRSRLATGQNQLLCRDCAD